MDHKPGQVGKDSAAEIILNLTTHVWDSKNDLNAYIVDLDQCLARNYVLNVTFKIFN